MKKLVNLLLILLVLLTLVGCTKEPNNNNNDPTPPDENDEPIVEVEEVKRILDAQGNFGGTINRTKYGYGAPLNGESDISDSIYYPDNDFYNMKSSDRRIIFNKFQTYQQTMKDSGGIATALMILNHQEEDVYNQYTEVNLVELYEQINETEIYGNGTTALGIEKLFKELGYHATSGIYQDIAGTVTEKIANFIRWISIQLNAGRYVMVRFQDAHEFGWHVIIGIDSMGSDESTIYDKTLIMADPYDVIDHRQDGYFIQPAQRFFRWWLNVSKSGATTDEFDCVVVYPKFPPTFVKEEDDQTVTREIPERHLILNADGSFGGTRDAAKWGAISLGNGESDRLFTTYHNFLDYYNFTNTESRIILPNYQAFQQTMASSCGICSVLSVLNYYKEDVYNTYDEVYLVQKYEEINNTTIYNRGVGSAGLKKLVESFGYTATARSYSQANYVDENSMIFSTYDSFLSFVIENLSKGTPIPISWRPRGGHWVTIIGIDTMGTDNIYDDVIILADSNDIWDHYQDGYNTLPATLFYRQWYNGSFTYNQQHVVFDKKQ
ncbi:MAG: hypothetical protein ACOX56_02280 [Acholeplasmataceae bacterium]|jgi:hypothetical protein